MSSPSVQYHFVGTTASNFNVCVVLHLAFAILSSVIDCDVSASLAVMGLIAVLNYNVGLLFLYILFAPASIIVDIVRMVSVGKHYKTGGKVFFILLRLVEMAFKVAGTYFGTSVYRAASESEGGYEQINQGPSQGQPSGQQGAANYYFEPPSYASQGQPSGPTGPVVSTMPPPK